ncbi:hypothetical protein [Deefgea sp. CFH1-16]|uniref:hypothetical protein n=1 Tax=Deefgea sp. CFH1-16 TaxID=2675457 RepID=UPI0015F7592E|nr:hypothetical protein [Deefgea sp. CFH1-16]MBM5573884.1 hypothetical protein [Deefgea sp. CFH1-16]
MAKKANEGPAAYLARDLRRITWFETAGELGNTLLERQLIQTLRPRMNSSVRHKVDQTQSLWQIELPKAVRGEAILPLQPQLIALTALSQASGELFGPFRGAREAQNIMNRIIKAQGLCRQALGLEAAKKDGSPLPGAFARRLSWRLYWARANGTAQWTFTGGLGQASISRMALCWRSGHCRRTRVVDGVACAGSLVLFGIN